MSPRSHEFKQSSDRMFKRDVKTDACIHGYLYKLGSIGDRKCPQYCIVSIVRLLVHGAVGPSVPVEMSPYRSMFCLPNDTRQHYCKHSHIVMIAFKVIAKAFYLYA